MPELDPEDAKLITLARASHARSERAVEGAAVRDETGRTYTGVDVPLSSLQLSALQLVVGMAVASGAKELEAAALVTGATEADQPGLAAVRDLGPQALMLLADTNGELRESSRD